MTLSFSLSCQLLPMQWWYSNLHQYEKKKKKRLGKAFNKRTVVKIMVRKKNTNIVWHIDFIHWMSLQLYLALSLRVWRWHLSLFTLLTCTQQLFYWMDSSSLLTVTAFIKSVTNSTNHSLAYIYNVAWLYKSTTKISPIDSNFYFF